MRRDYNIIYLKCENIKRDVKKDSESKSCNNFKFVGCLLILSLLLSCLLININTYDFYDTFNLTGVKDYCYIYKLEDFNDNITTFVQNVKTINKNDQLKDKTGNFNNKTKNIILDENNTIQNFMVNNNLFLNTDSLNTNINNSIIITNIYNKPLLNCVKNGSKWFVSFRDKNILTNTKTPEYMQVSGDFEYNLLNKTLESINAKIVFTESYEDTKILFFYTPIWQEFKIVDNKKVNLQIAISSEITTIGYPMIYGSF